MSLPQKVLCHSSNASLLRILSPNRELIQRQKRRTFCISLPCLTKERGAWKKDTWFRKEGDGTPLKSAQLAYVSWKPKNASSTDQCPVFLLHGLLGYKEEFSEFGQKIAEKTNHEVISFDARNHGESEHVDHMDYITMGDDVVNFMTERGLKEAIYVAHSMGAGSAISLAVRRPDLVKGLLTVDVGMSDAPRKIQLRAFLKSLTLIFFNQNQTLEENRRNVERLLVKNEVEKFIIEHRILPNIIEKSGKIQWRYNLPIITRDIVNLTQTPSNLSFEKLTYKKPVHILAGECSDYIRWEDENLIYKTFPLAVVQKVKNAGHWVHVDQPEIFFDAVVKFIQKIDAK